MTSNPEPLTFAYKQAQCADVLVDVHMPPIGGSAAQLLRPAIVYFHGGALTVGNRRSWFPQWLYERALAAACVFVSADYRLIPPATGHDILADVKDLFYFLANDLSDKLRPLLPEPSKCSCGIDPTRIAVAGSSSGGLCAYLAAIHANPRPKALLSLYGMGGDMLTPQYVVPKSEVFFRGRELLDPNDFADFLHPASRELLSTADSPLAYYDESYHIPGYPANPRMLLGRLYLQLGVYLDYYTGLHTPSLSAQLRGILENENKQEAPAMASGDFIGMVPAELQTLFPQFNITREWPSCFLVHGASDSAVHVHESMHLRDLLFDAGVEVALKVLLDEEHSFDYQKSAEDRYGNTGGLFDEAITFLLKYLAE